MKSKFSQKKEKKNYNKMVRNHFANFCVTNQFCWSVHNKISHINSKFENWHFAMTIVIVKFKLVIIL
jgi:hypothetical protein